MFRYNVVFKISGHKRASVIEACMKDEAGTMAQVWHDGTMGVGVEQATFSTYRGTRSRERPTT